MIELLGLLACAYLGAAWGTPSPVPRRERARAEGPKWSSGTPWTPQSLGGAQNNAPRPVGARRLSFIAKLASWTQCAKASSSISRAAPQSVGQAVRRASGNVRGVLPEARSACTAAGSHRLSTSPSGGARAGTVAESTEFGTLATRVPKRQSGGSETSSRPMRRTPLGTVSGTLRPGHQQPHTLPRSGSGLESSARRPTEPSSEASRFGTLASGARRPRAVSTEPQSQNSRLVENGGAPVGTVVGTLFGTLESPNLPAQTPVVRNLEAEGQTHAPDAASSLGPSGELRRLDGRPGRGVPQGVVSQKLRRRGDSKRTARGPKCLARTPFEGGPALQYKYQEAARRILRLTLTPTYRDLRRELRLGQATTKHFLQRLCRDGILERHGRRYRCCKAKLASRTKLAAASG